MNKVIIGIITVLILTIGVFVFLDFNKKYNSYVTPEEAIYNLEEPKFEVLKVIDTKIFEDENVSYVFFYSKVDKPKNYLAVAILNENKYGWKYTEMVGVGDIAEGNSGSSIGRNGYRIGFAPSEVAKVQLGAHVANIIRLEKKEIKAWLFHGLGSEEFEKNELKFLNEEGKVLESY
ncbi:hypothetical protein ACFO3D_16405 [Virgibacillus kekensis]|uniref:DUF5590 domain-containing protein n=1 Tax=Virgibacillus kekensis TaxID=202261 RepID=A0ABV9DQB7_9BACI